MGFTEFYRVFIDFFLLLPSFTQLIQVTPNFTEIDAVLPNLTKLYRVLSCVTELYKVLPGFTEFLRCPSSNDATSDHRTQEKVKQSDRVNQSSSRQPYLIPRNSNESLGRGNGFHPHSETR